MVEHLKTARRNFRITANSLPVEDFARHKNAPQSIPYLARARSLITENEPGCDTDKDALAAPTGKGQLKMNTKNARGISAKKKKQQKEQEMARQIYDANAIETSQTTTGNKTARDGNEIVGNETDTQKERDENDTQKNESNTLKRGIETDTPNREEDEEALEDDEKEEEEGEEEEEAEEEGEANDIDTQFLDREEKLNRIAGIVSDGC